MRNPLVLFGLAAFAFGSATLSSNLPSKNLIDRLQARIQTRFQDVDTGNFGISRLGGPYNGHSPLFRKLRANGNVMIPENPEEKSVLDSLTKSGWDVVAFTASEHLRIPSHQDPVTKKRTIDGPAQNVAIVNGPVRIAGQDRRDFSAGPNHPDLDRLAATAIDSGKESSEFSNGDWQFVTRRVHARAMCLSCHTKRDGHEVKVGDTIGIFMLGFRKT